ncbi:MAG: ATPase, T2SS/T4P/T4SS family [bacterium]
MAPTKIDDTLAYYGITNDLSLSQSILDIFVLQNILDKDDAIKIKKSFKTNSEVENFLLQSNIVTRETINKAYSIAYKLPYIELKNIKINPEILSFIPIALAEKYNIIAFAYENNIIRVATARPAEILVGFRSGIAKILESKKCGIEIFVTGEEDFQSVLRQYRGESQSDVLIKKGGAPVVYLRNQDVELQYLQKLPKDFIKKNRMVFFGENDSGVYQLACEKPDAAVTLKIVKFLEQENSIKADIFATSRDDIDYCLAIYDGKKKSEKIENKVIEVLPVESDAQILNKDIKPENTSIASKKNSSNFNNFWSGDAGDDGLTIDSVTNDSSGLATHVAKVIDNGIVASNQEIITQNEIISKNMQNSSTQDIKLPEEKRTTTEQINLVEESNNQNNTSSTKQTESAQNSLEDKDIGTLIPSDITTEAQLDTIVREAYVPKILAGLINFAINKQASDIHIEPEVKLLRVRCRIDGILRDVVKMPLSLHPPLVSRVKILSKLKIDESRIPQDGRFGVTFERKEVDVRVSTLPTVHGEKVVLRILDKSQSILSLEDLGMQGSAFALTVSSISRPNGMILSTGPTGSGKSTTLYAILNRISIPGINIITLEDPVEYEIPGVNQCQVKPEIGFTFASGLRSVLRQDPNVIMVGEIRDSETANMATHAALTGHMVISTMHTNDSAGALPRLINMGIEPFLITSSVNLIIAQRLIRRICPKCKAEMKVPARLRDEVIEELKKIPENNTIDRTRIPDELKLYYGRGCSECNQGYKGRIGIFEVLAMTPEIEDLAVTKKSANEIKEASIRAGMITMKQDGIIKAFQGLTTIDEVFQAVVTS